MNIRNIMVTLAIVIIAQLTQAQKNNAFTDNRDSKIYKTVIIGTQTWMAENLNFDTAGTWCNKCEIYGRLYTYETAKTVCPAGWHLPSNKEWKTLLLYLESDEGQQLKSKEGWGGDLTNSDSFGFAALPAGSSTASGKFEFFGEYAYWWTSTEKDLNNAWSYYVGDDITYLGFDTDNKTNGYSVRCLKD